MCKIDPSLLFLVFLSVLCLSETSLVSLEVKNDDPCSNEYLLFWDFAWLFFEVRNNIY